MQPPTSSLDIAPHSRWNRLWHAPIRAERAAILRIAFAAALLSDQLVQYAPRLDYFFGPNGVAPAGLNDAALRSAWRWTILFFNTDNLLIVQVVFYAWIAVTIGLLIGWKTRAMAIATWLGLLSFLNRNPHLDNGGDDLAKIAFFLLMFIPCGQVLSVDRWRLRNERKRSGGAEKSNRVPQTSRWIAPWPVRLFQLQLIVLYCTSGCHKLLGETWLDGASMHNFMNNVASTRWSTAQFALPYWLTVAATYVVLGWETFFPILMLNRLTRAVALWTGVAMHLGILIVVDVGWFPFYSLAMYGCWIPDDYWSKWIDAARESPQSRKQTESSTEVAKQDEARVLAETREIAAALNMAVNKDSVSTAHETNADTNDLVGQR